MDKRIAWLREQIAEDRRLAHAAHSRVHPGTEQWNGKGAQVVDAAGHLIVKHSWHHEIAHITRHDPRAVLARCDAYEKALYLVERCYGGYAIVPALALAYQHENGYAELFDEPI